MSWFRWEGEDLLLELQVQPRASRDELAGVHGERMRVRVTAPPTEGKANERLLGFLADLCAVARRDVILERGAASRTKRVRVRKPRACPPGSDTPRS